MLRRIADYNDSQKGQVRDDLLFFTTFLPPFLNVL